VRWYRLSGQFFLFFKWKFCSVIVFVVAVVMLESICDSKACGKAENSTIVFRAFHKPSFFTACFTLVMLPGLLADG
jgi:hypothetical protein